MAAGTAAIALLILTTVTVLAQRAGPGDPLYDWRSASEQLWRTFHPDPVAAELTLAKRYVEDLAEAANDPVAEPVARLDKYEVLNRLTGRLVEQMTGL